MSVGIIKVNHVNVTVPSVLEDAAKHFYGTVLGLRQIPKPEGTRQNMGAWYDLGGIQLHLSIEDNVQNEASERHVCYQVDDALVRNSIFAMRASKSSLMGARSKGLPGFSCETPAAI